MSRLKYIRKHQSGINTDQSAQRTTTHPRVSGIGQGTEVAINEWLQAMGNGFQVVSALAWASLGFRSSVYSRIRS